MQMKLSYRHHLLNIPSLAAGTWSRVEATTFSVLCIHVVLRPNKVSRFKIVFDSIELSTMNGIMEWNIPLV